MNQRFLGVCGLLILISSSPFPAWLQAKGQTPAANGPDEHRAMLSTYCFTCHNSRVKIGGLALDNLNLQAPDDNAQIWEKAVRKLRGRLMPPPGNPQPPQKDVDSFVAWMENSLDTRAKGPKAGYVPIQRLNRTEYAASVKALVGVEVNAKDVLPQDIQVGGFDNIAVVLSVSPAFLDQYITAARQIAKLAVGNPTPPVSNVKHSLAASQDGELPLPPGVGAGSKGGTGLAAQTSAGGPVKMGLMELLLQHGADMNAQVTGTLTYSMRVARAPSANEGKTALHVAAESGKTDLVRYLLGKGARTDIDDAEGHKAIDLAKAAEIRSLLERR